ncbi:MAG: hypothetical protein NUV88_03630, partial [Candidatus Kaiserbacteria bacterium]|nr:hypothetical protein [Candidatus Kaiserbacteria bacterium]
MRNPITALSLYSELLGKRLELDADKQSLLMLRDIQAQANRLTTLIDDLLIVGKIEGGRLDLHKEVFNLGAFTKKIISDYQRIAPALKIVFMGSRARNVC